MSGKTPVQEDIGEVRAHLDKLVIKNKEEIFLIDFCDIVFIERVNGNTRVVTTTKEYDTSMSLTEIYEKLDHEQFMRSHRSYYLIVEYYVNWYYNLLITCADIWKFILQSE